jgi:hypothetical protein
MMRKPTFMIIGCQKSGTTALVRYLQQHPDIYMPKREIHYFDQKHSCGDKWYCSHFNNRKEKMVGEKSPAYCYFKQIPKMISELNPECKIIICVREPVARAYSEYQMRVLNGTEKRRWANAYKHKHYLLRGHYAEQLKNVYKYFNKNQVMVIKAEELYAHRLEVTQQVFHFLGVDATFKPQNLTDTHVGGSVRWKWVNNITGKLIKVRWFILENPELLRMEPVVTLVIQILKQANKKRGYKSMSPKIRKEIQEYYKPLNEELNKLVGITWEYD